MTPGRHLLLAIERLVAVEREGIARLGGPAIGSLQARILGALLWRDGQTVGSLAAELHVRTPTISVSVSTLTDQGLVGKQPVPGSRARSVHLTAAGRDLAERLADRPDSVADAADALPPEVLGETLAGLSAIVAGLVARGAIDQQRMCVTCAFFRPSAAPDRTPHRCALMDADLPPERLRLQCPEHSPAEPEALATNTEAVLR